MQLSLTEDEVLRLERFAEAAQSLAEAAQELTEQNESLEASGTS